MVLLQITHPNLPKTNKFSYDNSLIFSSLLESFLYYINYKRDLIDLAKIDLLKVLSLMKETEDDTEVSVITKYLGKINHNFILMESDTVKFYSVDYQQTNKFFIVYKKGSNLFSIAQNGANLFFEYEDMNILFYPNGKLQKYNRLLNIKNIQEEAVVLELETKVRSVDNKRNKLKNKVLLLEEIMFKKVSLTVEEFNKLLDDTEKNEI